MTVVIGGAEMGEVVTMKLRFVCGLLFLAVAVSAVPRPRSIKSNAVTRLKRSDTASDVLVHRQRRQAQPLTPGQKTEIVEHHNVLRANEGADNMELMVRSYAKNTSIFRVHYAWGHLGFV